jgi:hypothetical protein
MKDLDFEERYFKNQDEWEYFLSQCGIPSEEWGDIESVSIRVDSASIEVERY